MKAETRSVSQLTSKPPCHKILHPHNLRCHWHSPRSTRSIPTYTIIICLSMKTYNCTCQRSWQLAVRSDQVKLLGDGVAICHAFRHTPGLASFPGLQSPYASTALGDWRPGNEATPGHDGCASSLVPRLETGLGRNCKGSWYMWRPVLYV